MEDRGPEIVAVVIAFLVLTWVAVALRCYVRIRLKPPFRASDFLSVASLVCIPISIWRVSGINQSLTCQKVFFSICSAFLVIAVHSGALGQLVINLPKRTLIIRRKVHTRLYSILKMTIWINVCFSIFFYISWRIFRQPC